MCKSLLNRDKKPEDERERETHVDYTRCRPILTGRCMSVDLCKYHSRKDLYRSLEKIDLNLIVSR